MVEKTVTISKDKIYKWIAISVSILLCALCVYLFFTRSSGKLNGIEGNDSTKTYKTYYDQSLKDLKKVNEALYDSIKKYSNAEPTPLSQSFCPFAPHKHSSFSPVSASIS